MARVVGFGAPCEMCGKHCTTHRFNEDDEAAFVNDGSVILVPCMSRSHRWFYAVICAACLGGRRASMSQTTTTQEG